MSLPGKGVGRERSRSVDETVRSLRSALGKTVDTRDFIERSTSVMSVISDQDGFFTSLKEKFDNICEDLEGIDRELVVHAEEVEEATRRALVPSQSARDALRSPMSGIELHFKFLVGEIEGAIRRRTHGEAFIPMDGSDHGVGSGGVIVGAGASASIVDHTSLDSDATGSEEDDALPFDMDD